MDNAASERDCEKAFQDADEEGKGYLTPEDYKVAVMSLFGYKPSRYEVAAAWRSHVTCDEEGAGLRKSVFLAVMAERLAAQDEDELIRQVFMTFDPQSRGFITMEACREAFRKVASHVSEEDVENFFSEVDGNADGRVSYRDFELMMKHFRLIRDRS